MQENSQRIVDKGVRKLVKYVSGSTNPFSDRVGAQFLVALERAGKDAVGNFLERFGSEGYGIVLNETEQAALQQAAALTTPKQRVGSATMESSTRRVFTRRRVLVLGSIGVVGIGMRFMAADMAESTGRLQEISRKKPDELTKDDKLFIEQKVLPMVEKIKPVVHAVRDNVAIEATGLLLLIELGITGYIVHRGAKQRMDRLVGDIDVWANYALGRSAESAAASAGRTR